MIAFLLLNVLLFVGCYLAGCLPISFNIPATKLRVLTIFGAGLLLGAALVVIIPEGVDALYATQADSSHAAHSSSTFGEIQRTKREVPVEKQIPVPPEPRPQRLEPAQNTHTTSARSHFSVHQKIGVALLLGYLFMLMVDQLSQPILESRCCTVSLNRLASCCPQCALTGALGSAGSTTGSTNTISSPNGSGQRRSTATIGLVFHSFADGLALGVAFAVDQVQLEIIMFIAIILHKMPAAFGLSCYLIHEGFTRAQIRLHLLLFASASPLAALVTYGYLALPSVGSEHSHAMSDKTGFALLLSGGTFLYVAASHILPELIHAQSTPHHQQVTSSAWNPQSVNGSETSEFTLYNVGAPDDSVVFSGATKHNADSHRLSLLELIVLCLGAVLPAFLVAGHSH